MPFDPAQLLARLNTHENATACWIAFSGGMDSHALLHAIASRRGELTMPLGAMHVDHGLHGHSPAWAEHCRQVCAELGVDFVLLSGDARPTPGESPEAAARNLRYGLLRDWLPVNALLLSAHHQDDQAETLLLQLLRGAGPKGLSAMPASVPLGQGTLLRPLLDYGRDDLRAYARDQGLEWLEDPSNADTRLDRNFLRRYLLPELKTRWPGTARVLARSAELCAEAAELQEQVAQQDLAGAAGARPGTLSVAALGRLPEPRRRNLLRHWLQTMGFSLPSRVVLGRILAEVLAARADAEPCVHWPGCEVRRYRDELFALAPLASPPTGAAQDWAPGEVLAVAGGTLCADTATGQGLRLTPGTRLQVRFRQGGEQLRLTGRAHHHALKQLLQESGVPPWERERLPLLYLGEELVAVADLWVAAGHQAGPGEPGWKIHWRHP
ncbi:MAG TPA: tRNA lysidine(34) synthetase TilS [Gammaproteobacteria bacterium]|nr:tRNA lysidine(34) synthetase TilS [Gammaproteobacteria bacterium]